MLLKFIDVLTIIGLVIGGLNWGLVGVFHFNAIDAILGSLTFWSRFTYAIIGVCAIYVAVQFYPMKRRWNCKVRATSRA